MAESPLKSPRLIHRPSATASLADVRVRLREQLSRALDRNLDLEAEGGARG